MMCIIGSGVVGTAIARELSKYQLRVALVERAEDVSQGASKANSGIVHGGYSAKHGTLKAALCSVGNRMFDDWQNELHFGLRRCGSVVVAFDDADLSAIEGLYENGRENGARGLEILTAAEVRKLEPNSSEKIKGALYCSTAGVTSPYELTIALAENAVANGVDLLLNHEVTSIETGRCFTIRAGSATIEADFVVNAAGVRSDEVARMVGTDDFQILPRKGEYILFERGYGSLVNTVIFQTPTKRGKGILVTSTYHGNLMIGPNAQEVSDREDAGTTEESLREIIAIARRSVPSFDLTKVITKILRAPTDIESQGFHHRRECCSSICQHGRHRLPGSYLVPRHRGTRYRDSQGIGSPTSSQVELSVDKAADNRTAVIIPGRAQAPHRAAGRRRADRMPL